MRTMMSITALLLALASMACLRKTEFQCASDNACGVGGVCEATGFCSFIDANCTSGRRYDDSAGSLAGQCTSGGGGGNPDGPLGGDSGGGGTDGSGGGSDSGQSVGCPSGYVTLPNAPGHVYKLLAVAENWGTQEAACQATSASSHLAIPDNIMELTDLDTLAAVTSYWVGITDAATEGTWLTVTGQPQTYLPWQPPAPDNAAGGQGEDCVESLTATHTFNDRRCQDKLAAICECVP
jgi:hypothetical protein